MREEVYSLMSGHGGSKPGCSPCPHTGPGWPSCICISILGFRHSCDHFNNLKKRWLSKSLFAGSLQAETTMIFLPPLSSPTTSTIPCSARSVKSSILSSEIGYIYNCS
jgi:hypothetical protein